MCWNEDLSSYPKTYPEYGDIICVDRYWIAYEHYGIYVSDDRVIHYGKNQHGKMAIEAVTLAEFLDGDTVWYVCNYPKWPSEYKLNSPAETVRIAESFIGKQTIDIYDNSNEYYVWGNNCEHFTSKCKIGIPWSPQGSGFLWGIRKDRVKL